VTAGPSVIVVAVGGSYGGSTVGPSLDDDELSIWLVEVTLEDEDVEESVNEEVNDSVEDRVEEVEDSVRVALVDEDVELTVDELIVSLENRIRWNLSFDSPAL
jgi:hypothetical protein